MGLGNPDHGSTSRQRHLSPRKEARKPPDSSTSGMVPKSRNLKRLSVLAAQFLN